MSVSAKKVRGTLSVNTFARVAKPGGLTLSWRRILRTAFQAIDDAGSKWERATKYGSCRFRFGQVGVDE